MKGEKEKNLSCNFITFFNFLHYFEKTHLFIKQPLKTFIGYSSFSTNLQIDSILDRTG